MNKNIKKLALFMVLVVGSSIVFSSETEKQALAVERLQTLLKNAKLAKFRITECGKSSRNHYDRCEMSLQHERALKFEQKCDIAVKSMNKELDAYVKFFQAYDVYQEALFRIQDCPNSLKEQIQDFSDCVDEEDVFGEKGVIDFAKRVLSLKNLMEGAADESDKMFILALRLGKTEKKTLAACKSQFGS